MLKFLFHRESFMVRLMEIIGLAGMGFIFWQIFRDKLTALQIIFFAVIVMEYLFLRFCTTWQWYAQKGHEKGIRLHFLKALVPTSYILTVTTWLFAWLNETFILIISIILLAVVCHVNIILIVLHFKDRDPLPTNFFSMTH